MSEASSRPGAGQQGGRAGRRAPVKLWAGTGAVIAAAGVAWFAYSYHASEAAEHAGPPAPPQVVVSKPLERTLDSRLGFLGQFSAVDQVELRAQVGGTLTEIRFKDGDIVHKGDLLFVIDPRPYEYRLAQATAQLESATARLELANRELARAQALKKSDAGSTENVEQRTADQQAAQGAVDDAKAQIQDARFDLEHCRIAAPFTGRIGTHQVSVGNLVAGSRTATSPTTLLATIVSVDPIYLNFDMSESDYLAFSRDRAKQKGPLADKVEVELSDERDFGRQGTLDFVDNVLDRSSGTLHARATVPNADLLLTPGEFARVRLSVGTPVAALLVPDAAVLPDQSEHIVLTVSPDGIVTPKPVQIGDMRGGLRIIRSGLTPTDKVIIEGIPFAAPGAKVSPQDGAIQFAAATAGQTAQGQD
ncbi:MexE family multidrug efflux RND transporter periplasmic adaptor subunit [Aliidongia dinghuensis]|uniref:MexE family multidrug efflux RND transporter periplasmic adaptor subunit n=1 Tax=Aliidongia dinghuensis TaxID=1867774 RepID=A0A8J2YWB5_9PROT|nr:efflux RND transporter periplasmic adaptor subunit [Aliidongia dinghuensis]GGF30099.1 MexE family multidrug efflux RND transporter periplasmic adaptor subunit [Aliidongia dinghuensis]